MSLLPRHPLFHFDRLFDDFWSARGDNAESPDMAFVPRVDVTEKQDGIEITAELPGVKKEDINISLEDGILTLSAESHQLDKEEKDGKVIRQERRYGRFPRRFEVGKTVSEDDINAKFEDGVLTLSAPKVREISPQSKRIPVQ